MPGLSSKFLALGGLASGVGNALLAKQDREYQDKRDRLNLITNLVSAGIQSGRIADPNQAFQFLLSETGGKGKGFGGKKGAGGASGSPNPLSTIVAATMQAPDGTPSGSPSGTPGGLPGGLLGGGPAGGPATPAAGGGMPQAPGGIPLPRFRTDQEMTAADAAQQAEAGRLKLQTQIGQARYLRSQFPDLTLEESLDAVGLKLPRSTQMAPKPIGKPVDAAGLPPEALDIEGRKIIPSPGMAYQPTVVQGAQGPEVRYTLSGTGKLGVDLTKLDPQLRTQLEAQLAAKGIDPRTADPSAIQSELATAGRALAKRLAQKDQSEGLRVLKQLTDAGILGSKGTGAAARDDLPIVQMDPAGRPDPSTQQQFLEALPSDQRSIVKGLTDYTINPTTLSTRTTQRGAGRDLTRAQAIALAKQYDPSYDEAQYRTRAAVKQDWSSGKTRDAMVATNTVVRHLDELHKAIQDLTPFASSIDTMNAIRYPVERRTNQTLRDALRRFNTAKDAVALELRKVYSGSAGGSIKEIEDWQSNIHETMPIDEMQTFVQEASNLMFGRIDSAVDKYRASMGKNPPAGVALSQSSIEILKNMGVDVSGLQSAGTLLSDPAGIR